MNKKQIDIDKYEGHTENKWEWYEFGDGDWILCPLFDGVKANEDDMWWVDENGEHINDSQDIFNWDERILNLASDCMTGNRDPTCKDFVYCSHSNERLPRKQADMNLIQDAPLLLAEVKRLRGLLDTIVDITLKELKIFDDNCPMIKIRDLAYKGILWRNKE